jgi:hypothetical protein
MSETTESRRILDAVRWTDIDVARVEAAKIANEFAELRESVKHYRGERDAYRTKCFVAESEIDRCRETLRLKPSESLPAGVTRLTLQVKSAERDTARLDLAQQLLIGADFAWGDPDKPAAIVAIAMPIGTRIGTDLRAFLDESLAVIARPPIQGKAND